MEPIRNTKTIRFARLKMYREDLDELVALFTKRCGSVTISDDKNKYDSLDEMKRHVGSRIKDFNIRGDDPKVHFLLNKAESAPSKTPGQMMTQLFPELRTEEPTDAADNLFYAAKELISAHQRAAITVPIVICSIFAIAGLSTFGFRGLRIGTGTVSYEFSLLCMTLAIFALIIVFVWANRGHLLSLDTRLESPSFFAKNREEFGKQAVTATISGLIGGVIGYLFGHYLK